MCSHRIFLLFVFIKYWHFFSLIFFFISFFSVSLHQHIISNAIHAQNAPTHAKILFFMSHFLCRVSRFAVIHFIFLPIWWRISVRVSMYTNFSLFLFYPPPSTNTRSPPLLTDVALKARETLASIRDEPGITLIQFFNVIRSFLSWFLMKKSFGGRLMASSEAWIGQQLVTVETNRNYSTKIDEFFVSFHCFFIDSACLFLWKLKLVSIVWYKKNSRISPMRDAQTPDRDRLPHYGPRFTER